MIDKWIAEATECDFKVALEVRKPKSWLKSVSAFANGIGGTLFFGIDDNRNVVGLADAQADAEACLLYTSVFRCTASGAVVIHLLAAVGAVQKPGQRIRLADGINALRRFPQLLRQLPCLLIHDSFVGVFKNQPFFLWVGDTALILIGCLVGTEVDRMPHILRLG